MAADLIRHRLLYLMCAFLYSLFALSVGVVAMENMALVFPFSPPTGKREVIGELAGESRVCQSFVARYDGLSRVEVAMFGYDRRNAGPFEFSLHSSPDAPATVILVHDASTVKEGRYHVFNFAPLRDSAGRQLYFCLQAPRAELPKSVSAWGFTDDVYPDGKAVFRSMWGQKLGVRDLDFRLGYRPRLSIRLSVLCRRLTYLAPGRWHWLVLASAWWVMLCVWLRRVAGWGKSDVPNARRTYKATAGCRRREAEDADEFSAGSSEFAPRYDPHGQAG